MALPNMATGTVVGQFVVGNGTEKPVPAQGIIVFVAAIPYVPNPASAPNSYIIVNERVIGIIDSEGYVCMPRSEGSSEAGARGVKLAATNTAESSVKGWTWLAMPRLRPPEGEREGVYLAPFPLAVPSGKTTDLGDTIKVPSSTGVGTEQIIALSAASSRAAMDTAADLREVKDQALANDAGVAQFLRTGVKTHAALKAELETYPQAVVTEHGATLYLNGVAL